MGTYQRVKDFRQRLKERLVFVMGEKCQICIQALDFHHLDPSKKEFGIGTNANNSWAKMREEVKKCILVCANCHREIHSGLIDTSVLTSSFSEDKAKINAIPIIPIEPAKDVKIERPFLVSKLFKLKENAVNKDIEDLPKFLCFGFSL